MCILKHCFGVPYYELYTLASYAMSLVEDLMRKRFVVYVLAIIVQPLFSVLVFTKRCRKKQLISCNRVTYGIMTIWTDFYCHEIFLMPTVF